MPPLVVIAMVNSCDKELTKVTYFQTVVRYNMHNEYILSQSPTRHRCLGCFAKEIGLTSADKVDLAIRRLSVSEFVVLGAELFADGEVCRCRAIP